MNNESASARTAPAQGGLFADEEWEDIFEALHLPSQQRRIVSLLLDGLGDKEIARHMG